MLKYASTSSGLLVAEIAGPSSIRKAAAAALGVPQQHIYKEGHRVNFTNIPKREGYLYVHNRAISSRANDNWDEWPAEELATTEPGYGYLTFIGKPVFVEHANDNHRRTRGVNIAAALHEDAYPDGSPDTWVQVYKEIDPKAFPKLAKALLTGRVNKTSMGADVGFSQCSKCGNLATTPAEYCQHIPGAKGARFEVLDGKTGRKAPKIVTEICRKVSFFEDTFIVTTPADPTAFILGVEDPAQKTAARREHIRVQADAPYMGGHTFHLFPSGTRELYEHVMEAHDPHGRVRGHIKWDDQNGEVIHIETHPEERRSGLGTELMRQATRASRLRGYPVPGPSAYRTEDGDRFAQSFGKPMPERIVVKDDTRAMAKKHAFKEITLPPRVDTLSHTVCPTCGSENSFTGDRCSVCNGIKPPDNFMEPDTSIAPEVQELLGDEGPGVDAEGIDMHTDTDLVCPECGESFTSAQQDEEKGNPFLVGAEQQMEEDPEMSEEGVPDEDEEEEEGNPFASKDENSPTKTKSKAGPDGESSVPMGEDDDLTQAQDNPEYDEASEADEPVNEEPGNMEKDTEINPEIEDGQPDADADVEDPEAEAHDPNEEGLEEEAEGLARAEMTGYNPGDTCPNCGQGELIPAAELEADFPGAEAEGDIPPGKNGLPEGSPEEEAEETPEEEAEEEAEGEEPDFGGDTDEDKSGQEEDEDDEGDDEDRPVKPKSRHEGAQVMAPKPTNGRTTPKGTSPNPAAEQRRTLINALNAQASMIEKMSGQMDLLLRERVENRKAMKRMASVIQNHEINAQAFAVRNEALERQMYFVSKAAGLDEGVVEIGKAAYAKVAALYKQANPANPAQPIAEPASEAPVATEGESMQPSARDDVTQLGATPLTDVSADASIPVDQPYGEYANSPVGQNRVDVTAPVAGTEVQRPPSETIVPVDVRVGNPDNPNPAFAWTMGPVGQPSAPTPPGPSVGNPPVDSGVTGGTGKKESSKRTYATMRLAKLQIAAGIASGDDLEIAAALNDSDLSDAVIEAQIETLAKVVEHQGRMVQASAPQTLAPAPAPGRRLVPKAASAEVRAPSLNPSMSNPEAPHGFSAGPVTDEEIGFF